MLKNTKGAIQNGQCRETGNIRYTKPRKTTQKHTTICVGHHYAQANTNTYIGFCCNILIDNLELHFGNLGMHFKNKTGYMCLIETHQSSRCSLDGRNTTTAMNS
jgi:hypothetical protein